jgi:hypothetical protein
MRYRAQAFAWAVTTYQDALSTEFLQPFFQVPELRSPVFWYLFGDDF